MLNYARYLPAYYSQMSTLPDDHPEIYHEFHENGNFSVQLSSNNPFGRIPVDQITEVIVNKDTQATTGTTKFSLKPGAVNRFYLTAEYRSAFLGLLRDTVNYNRSELHPAELQKPRMQRDESFVSIIESLIESWNNPFQLESQDLVCLSTMADA